MYGALVVENSMRARKGRAVNGANGYTLVSKSKEAGSLVSSSQDVSPKIGSRLNDGPDAHPLEGAHREHDHNDASVANDTSGRNVGQHGHHHSAESNVLPHDGPTYSHQQFPAGMNDDGSFTRGGSHNRRHFVADPERQAAEVRKSKELAEDLKRQMAEKNQVRHIYKSHDVERYRSHDDSPQPRTQTQYRTPQRSHDAHVGFTNDGHGQSTDSVARSDQGGFNPQHGASEESVVKQFQSGAKAAPGWLLEEDGGSGENVGFGPRYDSEYVEEAKPKRVSPLRNSGSPKRLLFDHERRQKEEEERQKQGIARQEELRIALEEQIMENRRRKEREREDELRLEREIEARRRAEAEAVAAKEQAEVERERDAQKDQMPGDNTKNIHKVETVQEKRRRLREDQIRAHQEGAAIPLEHAPTVPDRTSPEKSPAPKAGRRSKAAVSPSNSKNSQSPSVKSQAWSQPGSHQDATSAENQQQILDALASIQKELMEQRKKLVPLTPLPTVPPETMEDGSLVSHSHQVSVKHSSMTPPPGGPNHWNHGPQPYNNPNSLIPLSIVEQHPAKEVLDRNRFRLAALRNARNHDDVLRSFLTEDSHRAVRSVNRMREY